MDGQAGAKDPNWVGAVLTGWGRAARSSADPPSPAQEFAVSLRNRVSAIHEVPPPKSFTFLSDACRGLEQARKVVVVRAGERVRGMCQGVLVGWATFL